MPRHDDEDDEDDDRPKRRSSKDRDEDDRPKRRSRDEDDEDDEDDDRPRRRRRREDEDDDRPTKKPGLATAAGVLWAVWGVFCLLAGGWSLFAVARTFFPDVGDDLEGLAIPRNGCNGLFSLGTTVLCGLGAFLVLTGKVRSLKALGVWSLVLAGVGIFVQTALGCVVGVQMDVELAKDTGGRTSGSALRMAVFSFVFAFALLGGVGLAGVFALVSNRAYQKWHKGNTRKRDEDDDDDDD
jgi:hypothetical protein